MNQSAESKTERIKKVFSQLCMLAVAALLLPLFAYGVPAAQKAIYDNPVEPNMTPDLNLGKVNYEAYCASCHGKTARGTDKGPTFISKVYHPGHHGSGAFFIAPERGVRAHHWPFDNMPPDEGVNDSQRQAIIDYIRAVQQANGL